MDQMSYSLLSIQQTQYTKCCLRIIDTNTRVSIADQTDNNVNGENFDRK